MTENNFNFTNGVSYDVWYEQKRLIDQLKDENGRYLKALEEIAELVQGMEADECPYGDFDCNNCDSDNSCSTKIKRKILDIIADLRTDETKCNPDSEQIEPTGATLHRRNSVSVEQIQDSRVRGGAND